METNESRIIAYLRQNEAEMLRDLSDLVAMDSPSNNKALAEACADVLEAILRKRIGHLGEITAYPQEQYGRHILFRRADGLDRRVVLTGHYDTVWEKDSMPPLHREGDALHGPGVLDMKSGDVYMIWAVKALHDLGIPTDKGIDLFFTSDEEISGPTSRPMMDELFKGYSAALVLEPGEEETGRIATQAPGNCRYKLNFTGRAAHAGAAHKDGRNAIEEMAHHILKIQSMTDYSRGRTLSVGVCEGGEMINIVPDHASCQVDCRFLYSEDGKMLHNYFHSLTPVVDGCSITVEDVCWLDPVEKTPENIALYGHLQAAGEAVGYPVDEFVWGACSDANYFAMLNMPVLCSLGCCGSGIHARHEHIRLSEFLPRLALLCSFLTRI